MKHVLLTAIKKNTQNLFNNNNDIYLKIIMFGLYTCAYSFLEYLGVLIGFDD